MFHYRVCLNNGIEAFGVNEKTITANEVVETVDEQALAREISHENPLIPEQVAKAVLEEQAKNGASTAELDLYKTPGSEQVKGDLRIVEIDFLTYIKPLSN